MNQLVLIIGGMLLTIASGILGYFELNGVWTVWTAGAVLIIVGSAITFAKKPIN